MLKVLAILAVIVGGLIPAAHANRWHGLPEALAWLVPLLLLFSRRAFVRLAAQVTLLAGSLATVESMLYFIRLRQAMGTPWLRLAIILSLAALVPLLAAWAINHPVFARATRPKEQGGSAPLIPAGGAGHPQTPPLFSLADAKLYGGSGGPLAPRPPEALLSPSSSPWPGFLAWALTLGGLAVVQFKAPAGMLLAGRFWPGGGWLEASLLAMYAGFVVEAMLVPGRSPVVRRRIWTLFSVAFFGQLAFGLLGVERFLMTGALHLPVPALIAAGPLYRGGGMFMPILFGITVLLVGPAWCSHLCYIGAWDSAAARSRKAVAKPGQHLPPRALPRWVRWWRAGLAVAVFVSAWLLGELGVPVAVAAGLAAGFGLVGVGVMLAVSRRMGVMVHCAGWCPMGLVAGVLGRLSPWRLTIGPECTACGHCAKACRYDALRPEDLAAKKPGVSCSLCGDCLNRCPRQEISLRFLGWSGPRVRAAFMVIVVSLHALFLGVARI